MNVNNPRTSKHSHTHTHTHTHTPNTDMKTNKTRPIIYLV